MTVANTFHKSMEQPVSEVAIRTNLVEDVYVVLAGWTADGTASFKVMINPLVVWIWIGGAFLLLGGLVAMWPEARAERAVVSEDSLDAAPTVA
jgi:cytochrome c-type biogenesis protein CcmF